MALRPGSTSPFVPTGERPPQLMFGAEISVRAPVRSSRRLGGFKPAAHGCRIVQAELEDRECQSSGSGQNDTVARTVTVWAFGRARECRRPGISQPSKRTTLWQPQPEALRAARQAFREGTAMAWRDGSPPRRRVKSDIPAAGERDRDSQRPATRLSRRRVLPMAPSTYFTSRLARRLGADQVVSWRNFPQCPFSGRITILRQQLSFTRA